MKNTIIQPIFVLHDHSLSTNCNRVIYPVHYPNSYHGCELLDNKTACRADTCPLRQPSREEMAVMKA
jgi:hypothetical protein